MTQIADGACMVLLDGTPWRLTSPPRGRWLELMKPGPGVCLESGGPLGAMQWWRYKYEMTPSRRWLWRLIVREDRTEAMLAARAEQLAHIMGDL